jgi:exosortase H (IPTLxxWG-CTERM-specific)
VLLFALFAGLGFALVLAPPALPGILFLTRSMAEMCARMIRLAGGHALVEDYMLRSPINGFQILVANGCNGINVIVLLWSAQLAWPAGRLVVKLKWMAIGALVILAANTIRIISLFYLGQWSQNWFEWMHLYVWEILIMVLGVAVFAMGIRQTQTPAVSDASK